MSMGVRDERTLDLFFVDGTPLGDPSEEGLVRRVSDDLVVFFNGVVKSLTSFDKILIDETFNAVASEDFVLVVSE